MIDLDCLASTTYHHLNTSSLPLLYSTERKQTVNGFLNVVSVTMQATHSVLATYHVVSLLTAFFFHQWLYLAFQQHILDRNILCSLKSCIPDDGLVSGYG